MSRFFITKMGKMKKLSPSHEVDQVSAPENPFIIWTLRRCGGTNLAGAMFEASQFDAGQHEPFNGDRAYGAVTQAWLADQDEDALHRSIEKILRKKPLIKHCFEIMPDELNTALLEVSTRLGYRHVFLYREYPTDRLLSLNYAQITGIWGKKHKALVTLSDSVFETPVKSDRLIRHESNSRRKMKDIYQRLLDCGADPVSVSFEALYSGAYEFSELLVKQVFGFLGLSDRMIPEERLRVMLRGGGQGTKGDYLKFPLADKFIEQSKKFSRLLLNRGLDLKDLVFKERDFVACLEIWEPVASIQSGSAVLSGVLVGCLGRDVIIENDEGDQFGLQCNLPSPRMLARYPEVAGSDSARFMSQPLVAGSYRVKVSLEDEVVEIASFRLSEMQRDFKVVQFLVRSGALILEYKNTDYTHLIFQGEEFEIGVEGRLQIPLSGREFPIEHSYKLKTTSGAIKTYDSAKLLPVFAHDTGFGTALKDRHDDPETQAFIAKQNALYSSDLAFRCVMVTVWAYRVLELQDDDAVEEVKGQLQWLLPRTNELGVEVHPRKHGKHLYLSLSYMLVLISVYQNSSRDFFRVINDFLAVGDSFKEDRMFCSSILNFLKPLMMVAVVLKDDFRVQELLSYSLVMLKQAFSRFDADTHLVHLKEFEQVYPNGVLLELYRRCLKGQGFTSDIFNRFKVKNIDELERKVLYRSLRTRGPVNNRLVESLKKMKPSASDVLIVPSIDGPEARDNADVLRDSALLLEDKSVEKAYALMELAYQKRPDGKFIQRKLDEYREKIRSDLSEKTEH